MNTPRATITVDDPRAHGRHTAIGYARDIPFVPPGSGQVQLWQFDDAEYIPSQMAVGPRGSATRVDMDVDDWTVIAGSWTDRARLAQTPRTRWLWNYNTLEAAAAGIQSNDDYPCQLCVWVGVQAANENSAVANKYVQIGLVGDGGTDPAYAIFLPTGPGDHKFPALAYYASGVYDTPVTVSEYDEWAGGGDTISAARDIVVWIELTAHQWIIQLSVNGQWGNRPWVYQPPGIDVGDTLTEPLHPSGPVQLQTSGQAALFAVAPIVYPARSYAYLKQRLAIPPICGAAASSYSDPVAWTPAGTSVTPSTDVDGDAAAPVVQMDTTLANLRPLVGVTPLVVDAVIGDVQSDAWSSATRADSLIGVINYTRRSSWQGNQLRATVRNTEALEWLGNEVVTLAAAWATTETPAPELVTLFTGYLLEPRHIAATVWDESEVVIEALDWSATRGRRQHCINMRDLGSMAFADAFTELALRAGFAADRIDIDAGHGDHILPTGTVLGERVMHWRDDELISTALDAICADIGWRWGIRANGDIFAEPFPVYGGMPDVTLDGDDDEQFVAEWTIERDMEQYTNLVATYLGSDEFYRGAALAYSYAGIQRLGMLQHVIMREQQGRSVEALALAGRELERRLRVGAVAQFECRRIAGIVPDAFVEVQNIEGVDDGTVFMVVEEDGSIDLDGLDWMQRVRMVEMEA